MDRPFWHRQEEAGLEVAVSMPVSTSPWAEREGSQDGSEAKREFSSDLTHLGLDLSYHLSA